MVSRNFTNSHTLAKTAESEQKQIDGFCNPQSPAAAIPGTSEEVCKTNVAAEWLSLHRDEIPGAPVPYVRETFSLSALEAIEALKRGRELRNARAQQ